VHDSNIAAFALWDRDLLFPWLPLKVEEHGAAAIHLEVKVSLEQIRTRGKEKFNTTVLVHIILVCGRCCTNVAVLNPEHQGYRFGVVGDFYLCLRKMVRLLPHVVLEQRGWDVLPWRGVPLGITDLEVRLSYCLA